MSYSLQNTTSLTSLADAIRSKSGETGQMTVEEMVTAVNSITTGGGGSSGGEINISNLYYWENSSNPSYRGKVSRNEQIIDTLWDRLTFEITDDADLTYGFAGYNGEHKDWRSKTIVLSRENENTWKLNSLFYKSHIKYPPRIRYKDDTTPIDIYAFSSLFNNSHILEVDNNFFPPNMEFTNLTSSNIKRDDMFYDCYYLRSIPDNFLAEKYYNATAFYRPNNTAGHLLPYMFGNCRVLPKIIGVGYPSHNTNTTTSNICLQAFNKLTALHRLTFYMPNNQVGTMNATNQIIDLSYNVGWWNTNDSAVPSDYLESDITPILINSAETATIANLTNENSFGMSVEYSTYTRQSAIETINSLPDTTAAISSAGGTNTIKFKSGAGSAYGELYNMSNLTAEEIAVATAKGWTVELV